MDKVDASVGKPAQRSSAIDLTSGTLPAEKDPDQQHNCFDWSEVSPVADVEILLVRGEDGEENMARVHSETLDDRVVSVSIHTKRTRVVSKHSDSAASPHSK